MRIINIIVFIVILIIAFLWYRNTFGTRDFKTTAELIQFLSEDAIKDAHKNNHIELDYSINSIKQVEEILDKLHQQYTTNPSSVSEMGLGSAYGAYVGECIRRSEPGAYWERDSSVAGEKSYPLHWGTGESYPMAWCRRRILEGDEQNIWIKYVVLKKQKDERANKENPNAH